VTLTHMPMRMAILVALAIALPLGAYYVLYLAVGPVGTWEVHQGAGHTETDASAKLEYFAVSGSEVSEGRWFEYTDLLVPAGLGRDERPELALCFSARTSTGFEGSVMLRQTDGTCFTQAVKLGPTRDWVRVQLMLKAFKGEAVDIERPEPSELARVVVFNLASARDQAHLELTAPTLERIVSSE